MTANDDELEQAIGRYLEAREDAPGLLPGEFASTLPEALRTAFLRELEQLAELDRVASMGPPRDLPRRFGDFRVLGELGQGAMGAVYLAEQVSLGRRVALKILHAQVAADVRGAARFEREARTAASLVHPCIVPVLGFGQQDGCHWLAMGLVGGRSLQRLLQARQHADDVDHQAAIALFDDPRRLARVLADAADALDFAHRQNVVHRDVKPANLMVGDDGAVVVLDFGLATARADDSTAASLTRTGDFLGTPVYMAPEQTEGAASATARSDVYALGAVLYECLCDRPPVAGGSLPQVLDAIRHRDPPDPRRLHKETPPELARISLQCLEKNPANRYSTAAALADDLRRYVDGNPVRARGLGAARRLARTVRRRPAVAAAALLLLVAAGFGAAAWINQSRADALAKDNELRAIRQTLALSPEGITVFGGASRRWYSLLGLGDHLPAAETAVSPAAQEALRRSEALAAAWPRDRDVQRLRVRVCLDTGADAEVTGRAFAELEATPADDDTAADSWMQQAWTVQRGGAQSGPLSVWRDPPDRGTSHFWKALLLQTRQEYAQAVARFDQALQDPALPEELRYFAYLHRGWCKTCPELSRLREAEDDLLAAATLRPNYGTAKLLWAGLRCLDPSTDLGRPVAAVTEVLTAVEMEPWVVVLTARVLLAIAEDSTAQAGPVHFVAECSPLATLPVAEDRRQALAGKALDLLDAVAAAKPQLWEPQIHRVAALALLGRHDEALAQCDALGDGALPDLLRARVLLAAGRTQRAGQILGRALIADPGYVAAWRCRADLWAHVGDRRSEVAALERAAELLHLQRQSASVFPEAALALPSLQLRRARVLADLGETGAAQQLLEQGDFGGPLAGEGSPRVRAERQALLARLADPAATPATTAAATALFGELPLPMPAFAAAVRRGWLQPTAAELQQRVADRPQWRDAMLPLLPFVGHDDAAAAAPWIEQTAPAAPGLPAWAALSRSLFFRQLRGQAPIPGTAALREVRALAGAGASSDQLAELLAFAEQQGADGENSDARLLKAAVLMAQDRAGEAARFLASTQGAHTADLRGRFLLVCAALTAGDPTLAREVLGRVGVDNLEHLRAAVGVPLSDAVVRRVAEFL